MMWEYLDTERRFDDDIPGRIFQDTLNAFGDQGWELIQMSSHRARDYPHVTYRLLFKRPKGRKSKVTT